MKNQHPKQKSDYYLEAFNDELLLYHPGNNKIYQLNGTTALIWQLCNGRRTVAEIVDLLADAYPMASTVLVRETDTMIQQLATQGVIEFV